MSNSRSLYLMALSPLVVALAAGSAGAATRTDLHKESVAKFGQQYKAATATLGAASVARDRHAELIGMDALSALSQIGFVQDRETRGGLAHGGCRPWRRGAGASFGLLWAGRTARKCLIGPSEFALCLIPTIDWS